MPRLYLGDGVYAEWDAKAGWIELTTNNGIRVTNRIVLEPETYEALSRYVDELLRRALEERNDT